MRKTVIIAAMGSRGDVEPYVALGMELQKLDYNVIVSAPAVYRELVCGNNLLFRELKATNPQELMKLPEVERKFAKGNMVGALVVLMKKSKSVISSYLEEVYNNMQGADLVVLSMIPYGAMDAAEKMRIPVVWTLLNPAVPTKYFPSVVMPKVPKYLNHTSHVLLEWGFYICFKKQLNSLRCKKWMLPKLKKCPIGIERKNGGTTLLAYSESLIPKPSDWTKNEKITGFWEIKNNDSYIPDPNLVKFLSAKKEKPFYIGFGSMPIHNVSDFLDMIEAALETVNGRAVVYLSYNKKDVQIHSKRIFLVNDVPHNWLFGRVCATVIHGGIGTCRASLAAGRPTFVVPFMGDQKFWGLQVYRMGIGPKPVKYKRLTKQLLAQKLKELKSEEYSRKAKLIQEQLIKENGAKVAALEISKRML